MIFLQPHSGLANRIRVVISGLNLSLRNKEALTILWTKDESLLSSFSDLFELNKKFKVVDITNYSRIINFINRKSVLKKIFLYLFSIRNHITDSDIPNLVWSTGTNNIDFQKISNKPGNSYIYTCQEFYFDRDLLQFLKPIEAIRNRIEKNTSAFTKNTIGVHIRRADHSESIKNSPIELFIAAMGNEILQDEYCNFYLSTDDLNTELLLKEKFGDKVITSQKEFSRVSEIGIIGAMVDLYSLSATKKIIGSYFSSFSDIASRIGNIPLNVIKK